MTFTTEEAKNVAATIASQLGGFGRLTAMTNAKQFMHDNDGSLAFKFSGSRKVNYVKITLNCMDTYDVEFGKIKKFNYVKDEQRSRDGVYGDMLVDLFEQATGLYLSI